ncbi:transcription factor-related [Forsythia ovata]|uniref:Transcription factor-related n=1 Tax=Forsythia ovata TaxID=205694 RepID=A0ABD1R507_9LAMI
MSFQRFHDTWFEQFRHLVHQLGQAPRPPTTEEHYHQLRQLVNKVMFHCTEYYRVKSLAVKQDVLFFSSAPWTTSLERSLHWIGGWRPTTAFHLVYTESSILFESRVVDILRGFRTGDLGDLSPGQFRRDSASDIVGLCEDFDEKMERLAGILNKADGLRLKTIENVVDLLTPQQAAEFLVAAAELQFGIHAWGVEQDRQRGNV